MNLVGKKGNDGVSSKLPKEFFDYMKTALDDDYDEYISQIDREAYRGLRVNTLKADDDTVRVGLGINMDKTPFCEHGYYIDNSIKSLGNHPLHHAGAFYLQEPSAMSAVTALGVCSGDKVLDLCAAPGGKSTQIASQLKGDGLLVSNEIVGARAKILCSNLERMGVKNAVVTNARPDVICAESKGYFDKVLVDAPCSGEGMLRREPAAVSEWKLENHKMCADRTEKILDSAAISVKPGGIMVYSTCTLSAEEDEQTVAKFLIRHPEFSLVPIDEKFGRAAYSRLCADIGDFCDISLARRILYQDGGEGHFVAKLKKSENYAEDFNTEDYREFVLPKECKIFYDFVSDNFNFMPKKIRINRDSVSILPEIMPNFKKTRVIRAGVYAGDICKNRFEPSHALYMATVPNDCQSVLRLSSDSDDIRRFLHGEVIDCDCKGYTAVAVDGIVTGFGKASNGQLKNHYPKGLRTMNA